jgi:hypothetical protein
MTTSHETIPLNPPGRGDYQSGAGHPEVVGRVPVNHAWDQEEPRLMVVEAKLLPGTLLYFS